MGGEASDGPSDDDVAVLVAQIQPLPERLSTRWPADADALGGLRHLLRRWLAGHGAGPDETYDITVAVQEAAANAVEHAYAPGMAAFSVDAEHRGGSGGRDGHRSRATGATRAAGTAGAGCR